MRQIKESKNVEYEEERKFKENYQHLQHKANAAFNNNNNNKHNDNKSLQLNLKRRKVFYDSGSVCLLL